MAPLLVDPCDYLNPHHSVGHCRREQATRWSHDNRIGQVSAQLPGATGAKRFVARELCRTLRADLSTLATRT